MLAAKREIVVDPREAFPFVITARELVCIIVASTALTICYSYAKTGDISQIPSILLIVFTASIVVKLTEDLVKEFLARHMGIWAEYRVWYLGLVALVVSSFVFRAPFSDPGRVGFHSRRFTKRSVGLVSLSGLLVYLAFAGIFYVILIMGYLLIGSLGILICLTSAFFNAFPVPPVDGKSIFDWNKLVWLSVFATSLVLYVVCIMTL